MKIFCLQCFLLMTLAFVIFNLIPMKRLISINEQGMRYSDMIKHNKYNNNNIKNILIIFRKTKIHLNKI